MLSSRKVSTYNHWVSHRVLRISETMGLGGKKLLTQEIISNP